MENREDSGSPVRQEYHLTERRCRWWGGLEGEYAAFICVWFGSTLKCCVDKVVAIMIIILVVIIILNSLLISLSWLQ